MNQSQHHRNEESPITPADDGWDDLPPSAASPNPPAGFVEIRGRKRELLDEFRSSWEAGNAPRPEELLPRWPGDPEQDSDVASLLFEDFLRRRTTERADLAEYEDRFPAHKDSLADLVRRHAVLHSLGAGSGSGVMLALPA